MNLKEKIQAGRFVVTSEIGPPKGTDTAVIYENARIMGQKVDAINVTDNQSSLMRLGSLAVCSLLKQKGYETIFQVTCRDRNRLALQSDLLSAWVLGLRNILILTGDHPCLGDHPEAKPVFDLDSVQLLEALKELMAGRDMNGNKLQGEPPDFFAGSVVNPGAEPIEPQILKMEKKIEAGAQFFQTQAIFDRASFEKFLEKTGHLKTKIIAGVVLLKSAGMARYMNKNVPGVAVPENLIEEMENTKDKAARCVDIAARIIKELKPLAQGIHIMPIGWNSLVPKVIEAAGL